MVIKKWGSNSYPTFFLYNKFNNMQLTTEQQQDIQTILADAKEWGVENKVKEKANKYISEGHDVIDAYHFAFEDCTNL